ncbi:MAG: hypothetical protein Q9197_005515 [Variospora fuerteventurae]
MESSPLFVQPESQTPCFKLIVKNEEAPNLFTAKSPKSWLSEADGIIIKKSMKENVRREPIPRISVPKAHKKHNGISIFSTPGSLGSLGASSALEVRKSTKAIDSSECDRSQSGAREVSAGLYTSLPLSLLLGKVTCLAKSTKGRKDQKKRCTKPIAKAHVEEARKILKCLKLMNPNVHFDQVFDQLLALAQLLVCKIALHQNQSRGLADAWVAAYFPSSAPLLANVTPPKTNLSKTTPSKTNPLKANPSSASAKKLVRSSEYDTSQSCIRLLVPFAAVAKTRVDTNGLLRETIKRRLGPREITVTGQIYIYWFPGNFGHIKIGLTKRPVEVRMREWERKCGHIPRLVFPMTEEDRKPIPHAYRLENILKAHLQRHRRNERVCRRCRKGHQEWFEYSQDEAIAYVRRLSAWMRQEPYEETSPGVWSLKRDQKRNIKTLCQAASQPKDQPTGKVSTLQWKKREERNRRRNSIASHSHCRTKSAEPLRRSRRLEEQRRLSLAAKDVPDTANARTLTTQIKFNVAEPPRRSSRLAAKAKQERDLPASDDRSDFSKLSELKSNKPQQTVETRLRP